jgi:hypothetical protein
MLSDATIAALRDMEHHINLATEFVAGLDYENIVARELAGLG